MFTVKTNTDMAISWIADEQNSVVKLSQNIRELRTQCETINYWLKIIESGS